MKNLKKTAALLLLTVLTTGIISGCSKAKTYEVSYDYNAAEYINTGSYKGVEVELGDFSVTEESLQHVIDQILEQNVGYALVDRKAREGDQLVLNFEAYISGQKIPGFSSDDYELVLGSNSFLVEGFEEQLIGLGVGDNRAVTGLKIPEDFTQEASYAGRSVTFNVEILGVYEPVLPEYDDEFVVAVSKGTYSTVADYNKMLTEQLEANAVTNRYNAKYDALMDKIITETSIIKTLPEEYVAKREEEIMRIAEFYSGLYDYTAEEYVKKQYGVESAKEAAENIVLMEFIFQDIIEKENFVITEKYYKENLSAIAQKRGYTTTEKLLSDYSQDGVVKLMLMDMAENFIMNNAVEVAK